MTGFSTWTAQQCRTHPFHSTPPPNARIAGSLRQPMKLYAGTSEQFRADARMHRIAEKRRAEYTTQIGHRPAPSEVASWQNSLMALSMLVDQAELNDHGVILEYQLGNTSRRLDAMLTGHSPTSAENAVVVELKQWSDGSIGPSTSSEERRVG